MCDAVCSHASRLLGLACLLGVTSRKWFGSAGYAWPAAKKLAGCDLAPGGIALDLNLGLLISRSDPEALSTESSADECSNDQRVVEGLFQFVAVDDQADGAEHQSDLQPEGGQIETVARFAQDGQLLLPGFGAEDLTLGTIDFQSLTLRANGDGSEKNFSLLSIVAGDAGTGIPQLLLYCT